MTILPGYIPTEGNLPLIVIDVLDPQIVRRPEMASLLAWDKLQESERRWIYYEWFARGVGKKRTGFRSLIDDAVSAYLLSFESTLQVLSEELFEGRGKRLDSWLETQPDYDLTCRGIRTLRNTVAHVRPAPTNIQHEMKAHSIFASGGDSGVIVPWVLPPLENTMLPRQCKLRESAGEVDQWNRLVGETPVGRVMSSGIRSLLKLVTAADPKLTP